MIQKQCPLESTENEVQDKVQLCLEHAPSSKENTTYNSGRDHQVEL